MRLFSNKRFNACYPAGLPIKILLVALAFFTMAAASCAYVGGLLDRCLEQSVDDVISQTEIELVLSGMGTGVGLLGLVLAVLLSACVVIIDRRKKTADDYAIQQVEDDLRTALTVAEESAKAKSLFLDNMKHELRTPMNGVLGFLQIAYNGENPDIVRQNILRAEKSANELLKIIDNVLDFTEIENNKMKLNAAPFSLSDMLGELSKLYALPAMVKGVVLNFGYPDDLPAEMIGDSPKIKKVLCNLIDNAVKFTEKGKITVRADYKKIDCKMAEIEIYVRDTGIGIRPEHMRMLFTPFWQADISATRKYGGTGFGLALSKHLVTLLGGKIWVESTFEEGTTLYLSLPVNLTVTPEAANVPENARAGLREENINADGACETGNISCDPANSGGSEGTHIDGAGDKRVLLAEDVEINQIIAKELLTALGYNVDIACNGQEAIDMLRRKNYAVVLMDIQMPVMDGLTATRKIRENGEFRNLPIIAVSAHSLPADRKKSLDYGMNDHISKPLDISVLDTTISKWTGKI